MAITHRATGTVQQTTAQTMEVAPAAGMADGDLAVICATASDNIVISVNETGWTTDTNFQIATGSDAAVLLSYKVITNAAGEPANYTVDITGGTNKSMRGVMVLYQGVDQDNPIDQTSTTNEQTNSATHDPASIETQTPGAYVLSLIVGTITTGATPATQPSGYTKRAENGSTQYLGFADKEVASAGVEDPAQWSSLDDGSTCDSGTITAAIRPAGAGGVTLPGFHGANRGIMRGVARGVG